jgi:multidrug transporter EmrE-like cation transporter
MNIYLVIFITLIAALIASFSQTLYKKSMKSRLNGLRDVLKTFTKKPILIGLSGYGVSLIVYLYALSEAPLSVVYPTFASTFIFITILSVLVLKEKLNPKRVAGMGIIFFGILIIAMSL